MTTPTDSRTDHPNRSTTRTVRLLGAPLDLGADRRGVDIGPRAIRYADIAAELETAGVRCTDFGDLRVPRLEQCDTPDAADDAKYLDEIAGVTAELADEVAETIADGDVPIALGGDHATAMGPIRGAARAADIGVLWFDAHGDYNTPDTSPSGNVHGMPLAALTGYGEFDGLDWTATPTVDPSNTVIVGARRLDDAERLALEESDVTVFTMHDIDERGITPSSRTPSISQPTAWTGFTSASISTGSTRRLHRALGPPYAAASTTGRPTLHSSALPIETATRGCFARPISSK